MEDRALNTHPAVSQSTVQQSPETSSSSTSASHAAHHEGRGAWVLTAYGISGLALFGVLAYFFSDFIAR